MKLCAKIPIFGDYQTDRNHKINDVTKGDKINFKLVSVQKIDTPYGFAINFLTITLLPKCNFTNTIPSTFNSLIFIWVLLDI